MLRLVSALLFIVMTTIAQAENRTAVFAGGCFWCMEAVYQELEGVTDVVSGFTGGDLENPTYKGRHDGHYEAIQVSYDPPSSATSSCWTVTGAISTLSTRVASSATRVKATGRQYLSTRNNVRPPNPPWMRLSRALRTRALQPKFCPPPGSGRSRNTIRTTT